MSIQRASFGFALAGVLAASLAVAAPADSAVAVTASTPAVTDARLKRALGRAVTHHVAEAGLEASLRGYSLSPSLIELRRYVDPGQDHSKFVCIVGLSLQNERREIVAEIRGNAATLGDSQLEAIDAAAHSAVLRLPAALTRVAATQASRGLAQR